MMKVSRLVLGAASLALGLGLSLDAQAQDCDPPRILFVIDTSSSMLEQITEGGVTTTKWQAAQDAVQAVLGAYGDAAQYGLMTFPGEAGGCSTGTVLVDVDVGTGTAIQTALGGLDMQASRATPAGQTLVAASTYSLITDSAYPNFVVFMSDGWQYCSIPTSSAPVCASASDCALMGEDPCPSCNSCQSVSSDPACSGQNADGCYCVRDWPVLGVQALAAAGVTTYVVGFGTEVDALTLNAAADAGGKALGGCDPTSSDPSCYYQATAPSDLNDALADIVQDAVVDDTCLGPCDIPGERTCTAAGWSDCDAPSTISCTSSCGTTGVQECVNGVLTDCDAVCPDAGAGGAAGQGGGGGAGGTGGAGGAAGTAGSAATGGASGTGGGSAGTGGGGFDAGAPDTGTAASPGASPGKSESEDEGGCACRSARSASGGGSALLAALGLVGLTLLRKRRVS